MSRLLEVLERSYGLDTEPATPFSRSYLDTFDWALDRAGALLSVVRTKGVSVAQLTGPRSGEVKLAVSGLPGSPEEFPPGLVRDAVAKWSTIRALLPMVEISVEPESWAVLDSRRKTVARVVLERRTVESAAGKRIGERLPDLVRLLPIKGYEREMRRIEGELEGREDLERVSAEELAEALTIVGRSPGDYSSKLSVDLESAQSSVTAVRELLLELLAKARANEDGIRRDLDTEFLHDFRVSLRRTRTALSQIRGILPEAESSRFRKEFSWLAKATGALRDLDVYLLEMDDYRELLPPHVRDDLQPLQNHLESNRGLERRKLLEVLDSERYASLFSSWQCFLEDVDSAPIIGADASIPVSEVASREIGRLWRRVLKRGGRITDRTAAAKLHRLRIDCKKLRYLLEFFRSLAPEQEVRAAIGALKGLQDNLGDFNDYGVQQEMLYRLATELATTGEAPAATLLAMGRLVERLESKELEERKRFKRRFGRFAGGQSRRIFETMLRDMERGRRSCG